MPRKRRTLPVAAPQDQNYGTRGEQMAAQHALPLPDNRASVTPITAAPSAPVAPQQTLAQALAAAQSTTPPSSSFFAPSQRPDQPITDGLPMGPGAGPSTTYGVDPVADTLRGMLAQLQGGAGTDQILALLEDATGGTG